MTEQRLIRNTSEPTRKPWPDDCFVQGGAHGLVLSRDGNHYQTAFVEASPAKTDERPSTFLRGEGDTLAEAEAACWVKYERWAMCLDGSGHGPYERRHYKNGSGFCVACGTWLNHIFEPLPEDGPDPDSPLQQLLAAIGVRRAGFPSSAASPSSTGATKP